MSLNIKNKDAHELAQQLARLTGESLTEAVTEALRERLKRMQNKDKHAAKLSDRLLEIGRRLSLSARAGSPPSGQLSCCSI